MKRITFEVEGARLVGDLHMPEAAGRPPGVVVAGPMTSVKEQVTGVYAAALAARGIAALAIDHRCFGESDGAPRQYERHPRKIADLRAALGALAAQPEVDAGRIGAVGVCLGAGYLAHAIAGVAPVKAFVAIAGYYRDAAAIKARDPAGYDASVAQGRRARERYETTGEAAFIPAAALDGDAAMKLQSTYDYYTRRAAHPNYTNAFAVMSREYFMTFDVQAAAPSIAPPFLMIHGPNALNPEWADAFFAAVPGEKRRETIQSEGQTDIYDDPAIVSKAADFAASFILAKTGSR